MDAKHINSGTSQETRFIRSHSPYCEATGPIVKKGFVAAQICALQGAYIQTCIPSRSHSPMTPCPINQRLQKYESYSASKPGKLSTTCQRSFNLSTESFANGVSKPIQNNSFRMSSPSGRISNSSNKNNFKIAENSILFRPRYPEVDTEAKTISRSNLSSSVDHQHIRPRRLSITNEMTDMIDTALEKHKTLSKSKGSSGQKPRSIQCLTGGSMDPSSYPGSSLGTELSLASIDGKIPVSLYSSANNGSKVLRDSSQRTKYQLRRKSKQWETAKALITDRNHINEEAIKSISSSPQIIEQAWTCKHLHRSNSKIMVPINLRSTSADCNVIGRKCNCDCNLYRLVQGNQSELERHQKPVRSKSNHQPSTEKSSHSIHQQSAASTRISSAISGTLPEKAPSRWRWWNLVLVDKQPATGVAFTKGPTLAASVNNEENQQVSEPLNHQSDSRNNRNRRTQDDTIRHSLGEREYEDEISEVRPLKIMDSTPKRGFDQCLKTKEALRTSYSSSAGSSATHMLNTPKAKAQEEQLSEWLATLPQEESIRGSSPVSHTKSQTDSLNRLKGYRHKGKGNGIKRIQVIINLDGAADMVFEARLEGKSWEV